MNNDAETVVEAFHAAVLASDAEAAMAYMHRDVRVTMHFRDYALPYVGHSVGWDAARARLIQVIKHWEYLEMRPSLTVEQPDIIRQWCPTVMRHRRTGAILEATFRNVFTMKDGLIFALDGYTDVALLKSFLRMIGLNAEPPQDDGLSVERDHAAHATAPASTLPPSAARASHRRGHAWRGGARPPACDRG